METQDLIKYISDGFEKAKNGSAAEIYASVAPYHNNNTLPLKSHYAFGWIIYYALHQSEPHAIMERKQMLARYLRLGVEKPHKLHSMILTEALRLYKDTSNASPAIRKSDEFAKKATSVHFSIVKFVQLWNLDNLRPGDWRRKQHDGKELPSTVEKLITHYVDEIYGSHLPIPDQFMRIVQRALTEFPGSSSLYAQSAQLYEMAGDKTAAIDMLCKAIMAASSKFFLWSRLAALISDKAQLRLRISLLYKALCCPGQEDFKGKIHLQLASLLVSGGAFPQAKWELDYVKGMYEKMGWHLPKLFYEVEKMIPEDTQPSNPLSIYRKVESLADDFVYESLPDIQTRKTFHKAAAESSDRYGRQRRNTTAWRVTDAQGTNYWFNPSRYGIEDTLPIDTLVYIKVFEGKVVRARSNYDSSRTN